MSDDENVAEAPDQYRKLVLAADGLSPSDWGCARSGHDVARRVLEWRYDYHPDLSPEQEAKIMSALGEVNQCPIRQVGIPGTWWRVQAQLQRAVPLAVRLLSQESD